MALLVILTIIGSITTLLGLFFFGLRVAEIIVAELNIFKYKLDKNIEIRKENIDERATTKRQIDKKIRAKEDELSNIKASQKIDKVESRILLEKTKKAKSIKEAPLKETKKAVKVKAEKHVDVESISNQIEEKVIELEEQGE